MYTLDNKNTTELIAIARKYPYFQNIYVYLAKENTNTNTIAKAAIYASNRNYLKKILAKQKKNQQQDIITAYLKKNITLTEYKQPQKLKQNQEKISDLTQKNETWKNTFATETLAQIMVKQGHKKQAIEIYKTLYLKFPQKKMYFREKINQIKK